MRIYEHEKPRGCFITIMPIPIIYTSEK